MNIRRLAFNHLALARRTRRAPPRAGKVVLAAKPPAWSAPTATYIICTNPRSGSWLLSDGLASTSVAGNPREWFNIGEEQQRRARWRMENSTDLTFLMYLDLAKAESTTSNGISGIKLHYYQFAELPQRMATFEGLHGLTPAQLIREIFPNARYIWLTRRDKVRQAISHVLASSRNEWWSIDGVAPNRPSGSAPDREFDPQAIARVEQAFEENDFQWQSYFRDNSIEPLVIHYEDLAGDYAGTILGILKWFEIPRADSIAVPPSRLRRQSTAKNEEWLARYMDFKNQGGHLAVVPDGTARPRPDRLPRALEIIPNAWKEWVGQSRLLNTKDEAIVAVLTNSGYSRASALAEVEKSKSDPYLPGGARTLQRLQKGASLLNALGQLARLDSGMKTVERRSNLSRSEFRDRYYAANRPVILSGLMAGWRAMTAWTPEYLKSVAGDRMVEVMTGRDADSKCELNGPKHRTEMRFADYIDLVYSGKVTNDYYLVPNNAFFQKPEFQPLLQDFAAFPEYLNPANTGGQSFLWFGPAGTVTPLHHDTSNILMAQVTGRKRYRMIPSSQWQYVYNSVGVFSEVDCEKPDLNRYPKFREASIINVVVEPGEVLFVPLGWWHHVRALDVSMTISFTNFVFPNYFRWEQ